MFQTGDFVVYGMNGVCRVEKVAPLTEESERLYYHLIPVHASRNVIYTPVDNEKVPIRLVLSEDEARSFLENISEIEAMEDVAYKKREQQYKDAMKTCDCRDWVCIMKTAYSRRVRRMEEGKKATAADEKYYKAAKSNLINEMEVVFHQDSARIIEMLASYLDFIS